VAGFGGPAVLRSMPGTFEGFFFGGSAVVVAVVEREVVATAEVFFGDVLADG